MTFSPRLLLLGAALAGCASGDAASASARPVLCSNAMPNGVYRNFVQRCLGEKGFEVIGWN